MIRWKFFLEDKEHAVSDMDTHEEDEMIADRIPENFIHVPSSTGDLYINPDSIKCIMRTQVESPSALPFEDESHE